MTETHARYAVDIERDDTGPTRLVYREVTRDPDATSIYPAVDVQHGRDVTHPDRTLPGGAVTHGACPFCGSTALVLEAFTESGGMFHPVVCDSCGGEGPFGTTEAEAWQAWDTRAGS